MSWIVEQSENTSTVKVNGNSVTCSKEGFYGSPINVMFKDPADRNGEYFWKLEFSELDTQDGGCGSVGLTTEQGFQGGTKLKAMQYLGNLTDGSELLVQAFGDTIKRNDKVDILLQLTDTDLKMYIFHNDRPLGLAFHIQSPYPKALYPVVSFNSNGKATISRSKQIPSSLDRKSLPFTGIEGNWKIVEYPKNSDCVGCELKINRHENDENTFDLHISVVNSLNCLLQHNPTTNRWETSNIMSTEKSGPAEAMKKERSMNDLICEIHNLKVHGEQKLIIKKNGGEQVQLERFETTAPFPVTENIFS